MTSAFLQPTITGFSPVAPTSAPALSIADVAIELVPIAVISTSLQLFFIAVTSCPQHIKIVDMLKKVAGAFEV